MPSTPESSRLVRLAAILTQLQSGRTLTASRLSDQFGISIRTVYRDIRALEASGVPLYAEEGKGYRLAEGYRMPPVMFTEREANAMITAELVLRSALDTSLSEDFASAVAKLRAVLPAPVREKSSRLEDQIGVSRIYLEQRTKSRNLAPIQQAILDHQVLWVSYTSRAGDVSQRELEPIAAYSNRHDEWVTVAYCRLRKDFRTFSLSGIDELRVTGETFASHGMTLEEYLREQFGNEPARATR
ncbi:MAG: YafY family protein [Lewinella sp.]